MVPLIVVKKEMTREAQRTDGFTYLACVDGSRIGWLAIGNSFFFSNQP